MRLKNLFLLAPLSLNCVLQSPIHANETPYYTVEGTNPVVIKINTEPSFFNNTDLQTGTEFSAETLAGIKTIRLMQVRPSAQMLADMAISRAKAKDFREASGHSHNVTPFEDSGSSVNLRMSDVPVYDQGPYGTCVTFAATAALNAHLNKGDFINQQCILGLTNALNMNFWDGAQAPTDIFLPLKKYGIVPQGDCFGIKYPNRDHIIEPAAYEYASTKEYSSKIPTSEPVRGADLDAVKAALKAGHRVLIGTLMSPTKPDGVDIYTRNLTKAGGLWACETADESNEINAENLCPPDSKFAHEVVITGYDDAQKLLKIRNSWGTLLGDKGNYFMTYKFFYSMVMDYTVVL